MLADLGLPAPICHALPGPRVSYVTLGLLATLPSTPCIPSTLPSSGAQETPVEQGQTLEASTPYQRMPMQGPPLPHPIQLPDNVHPW